jgi:hypothetical protein
MRPTGAWRGVRRPQTTEDPEPRPEDPEPRPRVPIEFQFASGAWKFYGAWTWSADGAVIVTVLS